jgi:preprotein translocase subunit SecG
MLRIISDFFNKTRACGALHDKFLNKQYVVLGTLLFTTLMVLQNLDRKME